MKKIALIVGLFLILILLPARKVNAFCGVETPFGCVNILGSNVARCVSQTPGGANRCCSSEAECPAGTVDPSGHRHNDPSTVCSFAGDKIQACQACMKDDGSMAWTAIGCIPTKPELFIGKLLGFSVGIAGGIAFLLILFGGFQIMTSAGNPEQLNGGQELVGSAIAGLLLIIFSVFLLRFIGYNILSIPGFL